MGAERGERSVYFPKGSGHLTPVPNIPSQWDLMTKGKDEGELVEGLLKGRERELKEWIHKQYRYRFIPEEILIKLGVYVDG